eukprot:IDg4616t1
MKLSAQLSEAARYVWRQAPFVLFWAAAQKARARKHDYVLSDGAMYTTSACASCTGRVRNSTCTCSAQGYAGDGYLHPEHHTFITSRSPITTSPGASKDGKVVTRKKRTGTNMANKVKPEAQSHKKCGLPSNAAPTNVSCSFDTL